MDVAKWWTMTVALSILSWRHEASASGLSRHQVLTVLGTALTWQPLMTKMASGSAPTVSAVVSCDNAGQFFTDGASWGERSDWRVPLYVDIPKDTRALAIQCLNFGSIGGVIATIGNDTVTNSTWKCSDSLVAGWKESNFDDSRWSPAVEYGSNGDYPWLNIFPGISDTARWISTSTQRDGHTIYCRLQVKPDVATTGSYQPETFTTHDDTTVTTTDIATPRGSSVPDEWTTIDSLYPDRGPLAGGTVITLLGKGLQSPYLVTTVNIGDDYLATVQFCNDTYLEAITSVGMETDVNRKLRIRLVFQDQRIISVYDHLTFTYRSNPTIRDINPLLTVLDLAPQQMLRSMDDAMLWTMTVALSILSWKHEASASGLNLHQVLTVLGTALTWQPLMTQIASDSAPTVAAVVSCDDFGQFFTDGTSRGKTSDWRVPLYVDIPKDTRVLAIQCRNTGQIGGVIATVGNDTVTNNTWKCSDSLVAGWTESNFDDSYWSAALEYGSNGSPPWFNVLPGISAAARWIATSTQQHDHTIYCRLQVKPDVTTTGSYHNDTTTTTDIATPRGSSEPNDWTTIDTSWETFTTHGDTTTTTTDIATPRGSSVPDEWTTIDSLYPDRGPLAGGTVITLLGNGLQSPYLVTTVNIGDDYLATLKWCNDTYLEAITSVGMETDVNRKLRIRIVFQDQRIISVDDHLTFTYRSNPTIRDINPLLMVLEGGTFLTVSGSSLDSVWKPYLEVTTNIRRFLTAGQNSDFNVTNIQSSEICELGRISGGTSLLCPTPPSDIPDDIRAATGNSSHGDGDSPVVTYDTDLAVVTLYIGFKFDGYKAYTNISNVMDEALAAKGVLEIVVTPYFNVTLEAEHSEGTPLHIPGYFVDVIDVSNYVVEVGQGVCQRVEITSRLLVCTPPSRGDQGAPSGSDVSHAIKVRPGRRLVYAVGSMTYRSNRQLIIGLSIGGALLALLAITILAVVFGLRMRTSRLQENKMASLRNPDAKIHLGPLPAMSN